MTNGVFCLALVLFFSASVHPKWAPDKPYHDWRVTVAKDFVNANNVRVLIVKPTRNAKRDGGVAPDHPHYLTFSCNAQDKKTCRPMIEQKSYGVLGMKGGWVSYRCDNYALAPLRPDDESVIDDEEGMIAVCLIPDNS
jgi:hypothetical protein